MASVYKEIWDKSVDSDDIASTFVKRSSDEEAEMKKYGKTLFQYICIAHANCDQAGKQIGKMDLDQFGNYSNLVTVLNFNNNAFKTLPAEFFPFFPELKELYLNSNLLKSLPKGIGLCTKFAILEITDNQLQELPPDFGTVCSSLKKLDISRNPLSDIPVSVFSCIQLHTLKANTIALTSLREEIGQLENLKTLELSGSALATLPLSFPKLKELVFLDLSGVPWVESQGLLSTDSYNEYVHANPIISAQPKEASDLINFLNHLLCVLIYHITTTRILLQVISSMFTTSDDQDRETLNSAGIQTLNAQLFEAFDRFGKNGKLSSILCICRYICM